MRPSKKFNQSYYSGQFGKINQKGSLFKFRFIISKLIKGIGGFLSSKLGRTATKEAWKLYADYEKTTLTPEQLANVEILAKYFGLEVEPMTFIEANQGKGNIDYGKEKNFASNFKSV